MKFPWVPATDAMRCEAERRATEVGCNARTIVDAAAGSSAGFLGELLFAEAVGGRIVERHPDYDVVMPRGLRVEVKTTRCKTTPRANHEAMVFWPSAAHDCDAYGFVRVPYDLSGGWLIGWLPKLMFLHRATFHPKGEHQPRRLADFVVSADYYGVDYSRLFPLRPAQVCNA